MAGLDWQFGPGAAAPVLDNAVSSAKTTITSAYAFDGSDTATFTTDWPNSMSNATIEMWIRPNDFVGNKVLLELGGTTDGSSFRLEGGTLYYNVVDNTTNTAEAMTDISGHTNGDFIQIVGEVDLVNDLIKLYVDGMLADTAVASGDIADYAGTDINGLGSIGNAIGGSSSIGTGFSGFDGDIAIVRFSNSLLGPQAIEDNFNALFVPEPTSIALWVLLGAVGFLYARRRMRRK